MFSVYRHRYVVVATLIVLVMIMLERSVFTSITAVRQWHPLLRRRRAVNESERWTYLPGASRQLGLRLGVDALTTDTTAAYAAWLDRMSPPRSMDPGLLARAFGAQLARPSPLNARPKTCAVVGSSSTLLGSGYGAEIDAHDVIVRAHTAPTRTYERDVGARTSLRFSISWVRLTDFFDGHNPEDHSFLYESCNETVWVVQEYRVTYFADQMRRFLSNATATRRAAPLAAGLARRRFAVLSDTWRVAHRALVAPVDDVDASRVVATRLSTGAHALLWAAARCDRVDAYGFGQRMPSGGDCARRSDDDTTAAPPSASQHYFFKARDANFYTQLGAADPHSRPGEAELRLRLAAAQRVRFHSRRAQVEPSTTNECCASFTVLSRTSQPSQLRPFEDASTKNTTLAWSLLSFGALSSAPASSLPPPPPPPLALPRHPLACCTLRECICASSVRAHCNSIDNSTFLSSLPSQHARLFRFASARAATPTVAVAAASSAQNRRRFVAANSTQSLPSSSAVAAAATAPPLLAYSWRLDAPPPSDSLRLVFARQVDAIERIVECALLVINSDRQAQQ